ncbi:MAG: RNA polymerase sigma factor [Bacteroidota bacterium]
MSTTSQKYIQLIRANEGLIYKVASMYTNSREDREDLCQEIAFQIWRSFETFKAQSSFSTWMYRIALNTAIQFLRKEKRKVKSSSLGNAMHEIISENRVPSNPKMERILLVAQTMKQLDKGILLLYLEGFNHKEIAEILGISTTNVGTRMQRIRERLKKKLNE